MLRDSASAISPAVNSSRTSMAMSRVTAGNFGRPSACVGPSSSESA